VERLKGASLEQAPGLPVNIRLCWESLAGTNAPAFDEKTKLKVVKSLISLAPTQTSINITSDITYASYNLFRQKLHI
jgi:hypothetical protein